MTSDARQFSGRLTQVLLAVLALSLAVPILVFPNDSADLLALWLAGEAHSAGGPIYPDPHGPFDMQPPDGWKEMAEETGHSGAVLPYLYPPIWAVILSALDLEFATLRLVVSVMNPILFLGISVVAWRLLKPPMALLSFTLLGQALLYATVIGAFALIQNQIHILVAFLVLLAVERSENGAARTAGAALALAAAIKLFPALFAIVWLGTGNRRALAAFAVTGAALGLGSIAAAGWPLHQHLLALIAQISGTAVATPLAFGIDAAIMAFAPPEQTEIVIRIQTGESFVPGSLIRVYEKGALWVWFSRAATLGVLAGAALLAARISPRQRARRLWPVLLAATPFVSPLAWAFYFIPLVAMAPALLVLRDARGAALLLLGSAAALSLPAIPVWASFGWPLVGVGAAAILSLTAAFAIPPTLPARQPLRRRSRPL